MLDDSSARNLTNNTITTNNSNAQNMEEQSQEDTPPASKFGSFPSFLSSNSSRSQTDSRSEKSSTNDQSTLGSESPPDLTYNICNGRATGCYYPESDQPHCHLRCSPRACKQCREVLDADWVEKGRWLEDCISFPEEDEERSGGGGIPMRFDFKRVLIMGALAVSLAGVLCCAWRARTNWGLLQGWAAAWAQL